MNVLRSSGRIPGKLALLILLCAIAKLMVKSSQYHNPLGQILQRLRGPLDYKDPQLLAVVVKKFLQPPSQLPYNLTQQKVLTDFSANRYMMYKHEFAYQFCQKVIKALFKTTRNGFFVEAGAIDGEFLSNTLPLELENAWTGLLVEADQSRYKELLWKQRKTWTSNTCLATQSYPHQDVLLRFVKETETDKFSSRSASAHGSLLSVRQGITLDRSEPGHRLYEAIQCLPLPTLLLAVGVTHVDLVSLDVEGAEVGILQNFPWDIITVDVWLVEHATTKTQTAAGVKFTNSLGKLTSANGDDIKKESKQRRQKSYYMKTYNIETKKRVWLDQNFIEFFEEKGYELYEVGEERVIPNYVFILKSSKIHERVYSN